MGRVIVKAIYAHRIDPENVFNFRSYAPISINLDTYNRVIHGIIAVPMIAPAIAHHFTKVIGEHFQLTFVSAHIREIFFLSDLLSSNLRCYIRSYSKELLPSTRFSPLKQNKKKINPE